MKWFFGIVVGLGIFVWVWDKLTARPCPRCGSYWTSLTQRYGPGTYRVCKKCFCYYHADDGMIQQ
jgi:hypothetical protein